jgi:hypothetical protein
VRPAKGIGYISEMAGENNLTCQDNNKMAGYIITFYKNKMGPMVEDLQFAIFGWRFAVTSILRSLIVK